MLAQYDDRLNQNSPTLQSAVNGKMNFDPGATFSESFALFSKDPGTLIGMTVVSMLIIGMVIFIPILGMIGLYFLVPAFVGGFLLALRDLDTIKTTSFNRLFDAFKNLTNTALIYFVVGLITGVLPLVLMYSVVGSQFLEYIQLSTQLDSDPERILELTQEMAPKLILVYAIIIPYTMIFGLAPVIAITIGTFNPKMDFGTLLKSSLLICLKNPGKIALTSLLITLIYILGIVALCIGILVALPVIAAFCYIMYKRSLQPTQESTDRFYSTDDTLDSGLL